MKTHRTVSSFALMMILLITTISSWIPTTSASQAMQVWKARASLPSYYGSTSAVFDDKDCVFILGG